MRYFESKNEVPEKVISDEKFSRKKFTWLKIFSTMFWIGFGGMFMTYVYRKMIPNYRVIQGYFVFFGGIGVIGFCLICRSFGISVRRMTYNRYRSIMKNEVEKPVDDGLAFRKHVFNTLYSMDDSWTLFPAVYKGNPNKCIPMVLTGPGGVYGIHFVYTDPRKKDFKDPAKPLAEGKVALDDRLGIDSGMIILFRRNKKYYTPKNEKIHVFSFQELHSYISNRKPVYSDAELEKINNQLAELTSADMSHPME